MGGVLRGCPSCKCRHWEVVSTGAGLSDGEWERRQCRNCGKTWRAQRPVAGGKKGKVVVEFVRLLCPKCKSPHVPVQGTKGNLRHHRCGRCGLKFTSVES